MPVMLDDTGCCNPLDVYETCLRERLPVGSWWPVANSFRNPLGAAGTGTLLMRRGDLTRLLKNNFVTLTTAPGSGSDSSPPAKTFTLRFIEHGRIVEIKNVTIVAAPSCVTPGAKDDANSIYQVSIADPRYQLNRRAAGVRYNMVKSSGVGYQSGTTNGSAAWKWTEVVNDLWQRAGGTPATVMTLATQPNGVPENLDFESEYALDAMNIVLDRMGYALKWIPWTDTYEVVQLGADLSPGVDLDITPQPKRWDEFPIEPSRPIIPEKVRVIFRVFPVTCDSAQTCAIEIKRPSPPAGEERETGTRVILFDDLIARATGDEGSGAGSGCSGLGSGNTTGCSAYSNQCDLDARALERANDFYRLLTKGADRFLRQYEGPHFVQNQSRYKEVAWEDRGPGVVTTVYRGPDLLPPYGLWNAWYKRQLLFGCGAAPLFPYGDNGSGFGGSGGGACGNGDGITAKLCDEYGNSQDVCIKLVNTGGDVVGNVFLAAFDADGNLVDGGPPE